MNALAEQLGASEATIRRDLSQLRRRGPADRGCYGGASRRSTADDPVRRRRRVQAAEKDAIARRCAELVKDGESVLLDIGTTAHRVARQLHGRSLTVVTSNLAVCEELADETRSS